MGLTTGQIKSKPANNSQKKESNSSPSPQPNNSNPNNSPTTQDVSQTAEGVERNLWNNPTLEKPNKLVAQRNSPEKSGENTAGKGSPQMAIAQGGKIETGTNQNYRAASNSDAVNNFRIGIAQTAARVENEDEAQNEKILPQAYGFFNNLQIFLNQKREQLQTAQEKIAEEKKPPRKGVEGDMGYYDAYKKDIVKELDNAQKAINGATEAIEKAKQAVKEAEQIVQNAEASGKKKELKNAQKGVDNAQKAKSPIRLVLKGRLKNSKPFWTNLPH